MDKIYRNDIFRDCLWERCLLVIPLSHGATQSKDELLVILFSTDSGSIKYPLAKSRQSSLAEILSSNDRDNIP